MYQMLQGFMHYLFCLDDVRNKILRHLFHKANCRFFVFAACPKSASTYLRNLLKIVCRKNMKIVAPKISDGFGHNFISEAEVLKKLNIRKDLMLYGHIPYNHHNATVIKKLTHTPQVIVSLRPLPDLVISYKEHVDKNKFGPLDYRIAGMSECYSGWQSADDEKKFDYIINYILPWYIRFIASWKAASKIWRTDFITFEEHTLHPADSLSNIVQFLQLVTKTSELEALKNPDNVPQKKFNVGLSGRGLKILKQEQVDRIKALVSLYDDFFAKSNLGKYLLYGYEGLPFEPVNVVRFKAQHSAEHIDNGVMLDNVR